MKDKCLFVAKVKKGTGEKRWSQKKTPELRKIEILSENDQERKDGRESYPGIWKEKKGKREGKGKNYPGNRKQEKQQIVKLGQKQNYEWEKNAKTRN